MGTAVPSGIVHQQQFSQKGCSITTDRRTRMAAVGDSFRAKGSHGVSLVAGAMVLALMVAVGMGLALSGQAGATSSWTAATLPVASNFVGLNGNSKSANSISCPGAGECVAVGGYTDGTNLFALLESETGGVWSSVTAPLPSDAEATAPDAYLNKVSCSSVGNCAAVGYYNLASNPANFHPLILVETNGSWSAVSSDTLPADATSGSQYELYSVVCPADNNCTAVGYYNTSTSTHTALLMNEVNGAWSAVSTPTPANFDATQNSDFAELSCTGPGTCSAVGYYTDGAGNQLPLVATSVNGAWTNETAALPNDATGPYLAMRAVACPSAGACVGVGYYETATGYKALILTQSGTAWTGTSPALPSDAVPAYPGGVLDAVHCDSPGNCTAVGSYAVAKGPTLPLIVVESAGTWSNVIAPLPSDLVANNDNQYYDVQCTTATNCLAIGGYYNALGELPLIGVETNGVWSQVSVALPAGSGPSPAAEDGSELYEAACTAQGACQGFGYSYLTAQSQMYPIVVSGTIIGVPATTTTPSAVPTAELAATGLNLTTPVGVAALLLGFGGLSVLGAHRRRNRTSLASSQPLGGRPQN